MLSGFFLESSSLLSLSIFPQLQVSSSISGPRISRLSTNEIKAAIEGINHEDSLQRGDKNRFSEIMDLTILGLEKMRINFKAKQFLGIWQEVSKTQKSKSQNILKGIVKLGLLVEKKFKKFSYEILLKIQNINAQKKNTDLIEIPEVSIISTKQNQQKLNQSKLDLIPTPPLYKISISNIFSASNILVKIISHKMINPFQYLKLNNRLLLSVQLSSQILLFLIKQREHGYYQELIQNLKEIILKQEQKKQNISNDHATSEIQMTQQRQDEKLQQQSLTNKKEKDQSIVVKQSTRLNLQYFPAKQLKMDFTKQILLFKESLEPPLAFGTFQDSLISKNIYHLQCDQFFQSVQDISCKQRFFREQNIRQSQNFSSISPYSIMKTKSVEKISNFTSQISKDRSLSKLQYNKQNKQNYSKLKDSSKYADMNQLITRSQIMSQINGRERTKSGKAYYVNPFIVTKSEAKFYNRKARNM